MTKSIEEQAEEYYKNSGWVPTENAVMNFKAGAKSRDSEWLKVVNELETLYYNNPNVRQDAYNQGVRDCIRRFTKADQLMKDMGVENV